MSNNASPTESSIDTRSSDEQRDRDTDATLQNPLVDLTQFQVDLLLAIAGGAGPTGAEIKTWLHENHGELNPGKLYPNLDRLNEKGLVTKEPINDRANEYALTRRGERAVGDYARYVIDHVHGTGGVV